MESLAVTSGPNATFWCDKRVLLTGHTGFKGCWLTLWLDRMGAKVTGIGLPPATSPNLYSEAELEALCQSHFCDIRDAAALRELIRAARPEIVFHLAAQALVRRGYREPRETFETNVMGTVNVLDALRQAEDARAAVMVTSDKVYAGGNSRKRYREDDALGGQDPYSASKGACEIVIAGYRQAFLAAQGLALASARAGNVIGGGDWADDRLIPDAVRAWQAGRTLEVRRPRAVRPWQHVLEPLAGYLTLAQRLWERSAPAEAYNFGPAADAAVPVGDAIELARRALGQGQVHYGDGNDGPYESPWLALDATKAQSLLGVAPVLSLAQAVDWTMAWYRSHAQGSDARQLCLADMVQFETVARNQAIATPQAKSHAV
jgi:CDP-glucose 4,6-dehydratase